MPSARRILFQAREKRVRPGWDDKVLADWNGLAIAALARCSVVFDQPAWLDRAREAFDFILTHMPAGHGGVEHAWRLGRVTAPGLIEDQAAMARAALALYRGDEVRRTLILSAAERLANAAQAAFARRAWRILHHRRGRHGRAAGPPTLRRRQCHAVGQRHDGGGAGPAVPSDRRSGLAGARGRGADGVRRRRPINWPACRRCWRRRICWRKAPAS